MGIEISVSMKNEFKIYPDIGNNLEFPEKDRFAVVWRRLNEYLHAAKWTDYSTGDDGQVKAEVDPVRHLRAHIVRIENAPSIVLPDGSKKEIDVDLLFADYPEIEDMLAKILEEFYGQLAKMREAQADRKK